MLEDKVSRIFLKGARIRLAPLTAHDDINNYARWLNDTETTTYMGSGRFPATRETLLSYIAEFENSSSAMLLGIYLNGKKKHIGNITLQQVDWRNRHAELGLLIGDRASRGKGYAKEAITLLAAHAFARLNLRKLYAGVIDGNIASKKAFERIGFSVEGILREHFYLDGRYLDCYRLGLLEKDFFRDARRKNK